MTRSDDHTFDLVIAGASFAGLVAAKTAAMRGLKVAVIEAKPEPGHRVATTGILVKEAAEEIDIPHALTRRVHGIRLYAPNLTHIDLFAAGYYFLTTDTPELLRWLANEAARAGARFFYATRFQGAERSSGLFHFKGLPITARYILGADGGRSAVAQCFGLGQNTKFLVGIEAEFGNLGSVDDRFLHCFLDSILAPGYIAWAAPGPHVTQVGLAVTEGRRADLKSFLAATEPMFRYSQAAIVQRRSGRIPCGGLVRPWAAPGVMLVGDAAGHVSPLTGGGIRLAFKLGRRAAQVIADHLSDLGPAPEIAIKDDLPEFGVMKHALRSALDLAPPNILFNLALKTPAMRKFAQHLYFNRRGKGGMTLAEYEAQLTLLKSDLTPAIKI